MSPDGVSRTAKRQAPWMIPLLAAALLFGSSASIVNAASSYRASPQFEERLRSGLTVALVPSLVNVYQLPAGGQPELVDEWSEIARSNVDGAIRKQLQSVRALTLPELDPKISEMVRVEMEDARVLFRAVALSAAVHTYGYPNILFETKLKHFDYTLGPLPQLAEASGADALLFVHAVDYISSESRKALQTTGVLLSVGLTVLGGAGPFVVPRGGPTVMWAALVDVRTGDLLWFNRHVSGGIHDLRDPASAEPFVADAVGPLAQKLPIRNRGTEQDP